jgi:hypothetical protein
MLPAPPLHAPYPQLFKTGSCYVALAVLELEILLPLLPSAESAGVKPTPGSPLYSRAIVC